MLLTASVISAVTISGTSLALFLVVYTISFDVVILRKIKKWYISEDSNDGGSRCNELGFELKLLLRVASLDSRRVTSRVLLHSTKLHETDHHTT